MCRTCGLAVARTLSADTPVQGWWGLASFFITPFVLLHNAWLIHRLERLPSACRTHPAVDPGRPLWLRPHILGLLIPVLLVMALTLGG